MDPTAPSDRLREAGLRRTPARIAIFARVCAADHPQSHAELRLDPALEGIDEITLYRTLSTLEGSRLIHRVLGLDGVWRYSNNPVGTPGCPGNHAHFYCTGCGKMTCLVDQPMSRILAPEGAAVEGRQMVAWGQCAACRCPPAKAESP